jgi:hypothetical protein
MSSRHWCPRASHQGVEPRHLKRTAGGGATEPGEILSQNPAVGRVPANAQSMPHRPQGAAAVTPRCVGKRPPYHCKGWCRSLRS